MDTVSHWGPICIRITRLPFLCTLTFKGGVLCTGVFLFHTRITRAAFPQIAIIKGGGSNYMLCLSPFIGRSGAECGHSWAIITESYTFTAIGCYVCE